ncbi:MAG: PP2C family serine/threonine-protein phosphatase [Pyrinomonadaceae bacterium]
MSERATEISVQSAAVTDRGLNERRPLNEDSHLNDAGRCIFAVADGVGGAEAGEVASQTAIEVLERAFHQHSEGDDPEDLMEIAIQRANASIFKMSREQPKYSMMATTIVALHLDGLRATIGHVGDSRLYRLTPDGSLQRETEDHSVVEEEVRAGRMTAEQAANHPSRNVISRALGAESAVEVDMKTIEIEPGTLFLLCSDGITRHLPDNELASILQSQPSIEDACAEMKKLCFERGAEDNLTAVIVRAGQQTSPASNDTGEQFDEEATILSQRPLAVASVSSAAGDHADPLLHRPFNEGQAVSTTSSSDARPTGESTGTVIGSTPPQNNQPGAKRSGGAGRVLGLLFLVAAFSTLAFYGGMLYGQRGVQQGFAATNAAPTPAASPLESPEASFERRRRAVDLSPATEVARMTAETNGLPADSGDPEFLYLYGRALLLTGKSSDAAAAFEKSIQRINENMTSRNGQLKIDARLATVAAHLKADDAAKAHEAARELDDVMRVGDGAAQQDAQPSPAASPF